MLVLSRHANETIVIGDDKTGENLITITLVEMRGDKVLIGIDAPRDLDVHRGEVWNRIQGENHAAK